MLTKKEVKELYNRGEKEVIASYCSNIGHSINIVEIDYDIDDSVIGFQQINDDKHWFKRKIYYGDSPYFILDNQRYYLDEFLRTDI